MEVTGQLRVANAFDKHLAKMEALVRQNIIRNLAYVGEQCNNKARNSGSYHDQSGNLRSSIGYVIVEDGRILSMGGFTTVRGGAEGASEGKSYIKSLASKYPSGIVLIVVAGMNYATYVSAKGYDVLESSELLAKKLVPQMLSKLGFK